jgi:ketosteroid isomerase-like protein
MTQKNTEIVKKYFDSLSRGDLATLGSLFAEDVTWHQPGHGKLSRVYKGKSELFPLFGKFMELSQGSFRIDEVRSIMANDDLVTATLHFSAKRDQKKISMDGVDLMKIENEKIKEVWLFSGDQKAEDAFWDFG